jgi:hypothetical protein
VGKATVWATNTEGMLGSMMNRPAARFWQKQPAHCYSAEVPHRRNLIDCKEFLDGVPVECGGGSDIHDFAFL